MNTPAHAVANLLILGRKGKPHLAWPIVAGAILPDVPMFVFYAVVKLGERLPEREIWSHAYYRPGWQAVFDGFHSLPLIALCLLVAWRLGAERWTALFASMALHVPEDFFLHHEDGHRHFFPFSDWRFASPVSYWDPAYHGTLIGGLEALMVIFGSLFLWRRYEARFVRAAIAAVGGLYALFFVFALVTWADGLAAN
ncbi:MAG TPA: metal-dependent hydrolase [Thermoanaerobaculia bacterium]|nr:metal-dependent hydrolase [Thermoanaerobaculia bacterium]